MQYFFKSSENKIFIIRNYISVVYVEGIKIFLKYCISVVAIKEIK